MKCPKCNKLVSEKDGYSAQLFSKAEAEKLGLPNPNPEDHRHSQGYICPHCGYKWETWRK